MRVEFTRRAERELRRIADHAVRRRILKRVSMLKDEPRPPGARKLSDAKDVWRVRVGADRAAGEPVEWSEAALDAISAPCGADRRAIALPAPSTSHLKTEDFYLGL